MRLTSSAFAYGAMIPVKHTCDSLDISPQLTVSGIPPKAISLVLICDDPDAPMGTWVHWVMFNLSPELAELPEGITDGISPGFGKDTSGTAKHGVNDFKRFGYGGPCPPKGSVHRYFFKLYALDTFLEFDKDQITGGITVDALTLKMKDHIVAETHLMGKYKR